MSGILRIDAFQDGAMETAVHTRPTANAEAELKLIAPAGTLERLREAPPIARYARDTGAVRQLDAVYYDTLDRTLFSNGLSLRVRRSGDGFIQTLKRGPAQGEPFVRTEWETEVAGTAPDLSLLPTDEIGAPLDGLGSCVLGPVFATKVHRRTQQLDLPGAVVEVAFDDGVIESGEHREPVSEVELEVKAGDLRALYDLGLQLLEIAPLRLGTRSKSDRGYSLAFGVSPKSMKAASPAISPDHTVDDIIGMLLGSCQDHLLANQAVAEAGFDPEGAHQMRVALRRMRTISALLHRQLGLPTLEAFNAEAKWLGRVLGAAREWDVFVTDTLRAPSEALGRQIDFAALRQAAEPHRTAAYTGLREALASARYSRLQLAIRQWIHSRGWRNELQNKSLAVLLETAHDFTGRTLAQLHRKVVRKGAHFQHLRPEDRHRVRIALKKLRYVTEFFRHAQRGNDQIQGFLASIAKLQDALGHDNDAAMTAPLLSTLERDELAQGVQQSIGVVMGWQARDRLAEAAALKKQWRRFKAAAPHWPGGSD
jgi:triphosphatase